MTIGLGASCTDIPLLVEVDVPIVSRSRDLNAIVRQVPKARVDAREGPAGWNEAIVEIFTNQGKST